LKGVGYIYFGFPPAEFRRRRKGGPAIGCGQPGEQFRVADRFLGVNRHDTCPHQDKQQADHCQHMPAR
jgi:hypothetical protein